MLACLLFEYLQLKLLPFFLESTNILLEKRVIILLTISEIQNPKS